MWKWQLLCNCSFQSGGTKALRWGQIVAGLVFMTGSELTCGGIIVWCVIPVANSKCVSVSISEQECLHKHIVINPSLMYLQN